MITKITYEDKEALQNDESVANKNKVTETDMNEIKNAVNANADELTSLKENVESLDTEVENKVDKVDGKGLSTNDYTTAEKEKLAGLSNYDDTEVKQDIANIEAEQTEQNQRITALEEEKIELEKDIDGLSIFGQASGESIDLNDSSSARVKRFEVTGNSIQDGEPSIDNPVEVQSAGEKDLKFEQGTINSSYGNNTTSTTRLRTIDYVEIQSNVEKTINAEGMDNVSVFEYDNSKKFIKTSGWQNIPYTFTTSENTKFYKLIFKKSDDSEVTADMLSNVVVTPYEINEVVCNKNFVNDTNLIPKTQNNVTVAYNAKNQITFSGTSSISNHFIIYSIPVTLSKGIYYFNYIGKHQRPYFSLRDKDGNWIQYLISPNSTKKDFEVTEKSSNLIIAVHIQPGINFTTENTAFNIILSKDELPNSYIVHEGQNISIPTQQSMMSGDYFVKEEDGWKEVHLWNKYTFTGKENITLGQNLTNMTKFVFSQIQEYVEKTDNNSIAKLLSNYFLCIQSANNQWRNDSIQDITVNSAGNFTFSISNNIAKTVADFQSLLQEKYNEGNAVYVLYKLATPTKLSCTAEQIEILDKLDNIRTYKNVTHIFSNDEVSANVDITYRKDLETVLNNLVQTTENESEVSA